MKINAWEPPTSVEARFLDETSTKNFLTEQHSSQFTMEKAKMAKKETIAFWEGEKKLPENNTRVLLFTQHENCF